ncbi:MAG: hypothetical protein GVY36_08875 [Verrucomicrobia bacterium]|jgi:hypothetical protein|nr:hypothetical protein [Verrucomicrobiota bacterium]
MLRLFLVLHAVTAFVSSTAVLSARAPQPAEAKMSPVRPQASNQGSPKHLQSFSLSDLPGQSHRSKAAAPERARQQGQKSARFGGRSAQTLAPLEHMEIALPEAARRFSVALKPPVASVFENGNFLNWNGLSVACLATEKGVATLVLKTPSGEQVPLEVLYRIAEESETQDWVRLAIDFKESDEGTWFYALSLEGTPIYAESISAPEYRLSLQNPSHTNTLAVGGIGLDTGHPAATKRSPLWKEASASPRQAPRATQKRDLAPLLSEDVRQLQAGYPAIHRKILPGQLELREEAWMLSRTVDRQFWLNPEVRPRRRALERYIEKVPADDSDFIPALSTRGWDAPWDYYDHGEHYLERLRFYLVPEESGTYSFWLATGGIAALYLDTDLTDASPATVIAETGPKAKKNFGKESLVKTEPLELEAGIPYYIEIIHYEEPGFDYLTLGWTSPGAPDPGAIEPIPMDVISSFSSGIPGSFPRSLYPRAPEWLPATVPNRLNGSAFWPESDESLVIHFATLPPGGNQLVPGQPIYEADFASVSNGWLFHHKLGWLFSGSSFPSIYQSSMGRWLHYVEGGAYQQVFFDYSAQEWFSVFNITGEWLVYHPTFTSHPATQTVDALGSVTFSSTITRPENAFTGYLIKGNGAGGVIVASGADQLEFTLESVNANDSGNYRIEVINMATSVSSSTATLSVNRLNHTVTISGPAVLDEGETATYTAGNVKGSLSWNLGDGLMLVSQTGSSVTVQATAAIGTPVLTANDAGSSVYLPTTRHQAITLQPGPLDRLIDFFNAQYVSGNQYDSPWFGTFFVGSYPNWIFHETHGWLSISTSPAIGASGVSVYSPQLKHFWVFKPSDPLSANGFSLSLFAMPVGYQNVFHRNDGLLVRSFYLYDQNRWVTLSDYEDAIQPDFDQDGLGDWTEIDYFGNLDRDLYSDLDGDGMSDWWEMQNFGSLASNPYDDADGDWLSNLEEFVNETDPNNRDTDGDYISDSQEVQNGTNPTVADLPTAVSFSLPSGGHPSAINLELSNTLWPQYIRYTTDGSEPSLLSPRYNSTAPLVVGANQQLTVHAKVILPNGHSGPLSTGTWRTGHYAPESQTVYYGWLPFSGKMGYSLNPSSLASAINLYAPKNYLVMGRGWIIDGVFEPDLNTPAQELFYGATLTPQNGSWAVLEGYSVDADVFYDARTQSPSSTFFNYRPVGKGWLASENAPITSKNDENKVDVFYTHTYFYFGPNDTVYRWLLTSSNASQVPTPNFNVFKIGKGWITSLETMEPDSQTASSNIRHGIVMSSFNSVKQICTSDWSDYYPNFELYNSVRMGKGWALGPSGMVPDTREVPMPIFYGEKWFAGFPDESTRMFTPYPDDLITFASPGFPPTSPQLFIPVASGYMLGAQKYKIAWVDLPQVVYQGIERVAPTLLPHQTFLSHDLSMLANSPAPQALGTGWIENNTFIEYIDDQDGLDLATELSHGTNPISVDTDSDSVSDALEITYGFDPLAANDFPNLDTDGDGLPDSFEIQFGFDPNSAETNDNYINEPLNLGVPPGPDTLPQAPPPLAASDYAILIESKSIEFPKYGHTTFQSISPAKRFLTKRAIQTLVDIDGKVESGPFAINGTGTWMINPITGEETPGGDQYENQFYVSSFGDPISPTRLAGTRIQQGYEDPPDKEDDGEATINGFTLLTDENTTAMMTTNGVNELEDYTNDFTASSVAPHAYRNVHENELRFDYRKVQFKFKWEAGTEEEEKFPIQYFVLFIPEDDLNTAENEEETELEIVDTIEWNGELEESRVFEIDPDSLKYGEDGRYRLLKVEFEIHDENGTPQIATEDDPANVPVNGDFDEEKQVNGRYVRDYEDANLELADDSDTLLTDDLRGCVVDIPGLPDEAWQNTTLKIRKKAGVIDPETNEEEAGEIRIHAIDGSNNWVEVPLDTDLAPEYYVSTGQYADYDSCWIEGIKDGPITIELEVVINGGTPILVEKKAMICTEKTKAEWLQELRDEMELLSSVDMNQFDPSDGFMPNRSYLQAVYFYYEEMFVRDLDYVWPGMAKMAGAPVYGGLSDAEYGDSVFSIPLVISILGLGAGVEEVNLTNLSTIQTTLVGVNKAIYEDLAWQFKAYHTSGLSAVKYTSELPETDPDDIDIETWNAFDAAQESDYSLVQDANRLLLLREQSEIVVPGWSTIAGLDLVKGVSANYTSAGEVFSRMAENPIPGGNDFRDVVPGGDITDFVDRWEWIDDSSQGMWKLWTDFSIVQQRSYVEIQLKTRAEDYAKSVIIFLPVL